VQNQWHACIDGRTRERTKMAIEVYFTLSLLVFRILGKDLWKRWENARESLPVLMHRIEIQEDSWKTPTFIRPLAQAARLEILEGSLG